MISFEAASIYMQKDDLVMPGFYILSDSKLLQFIKVLSSCTKYIVALEPEVKNTSLGSYPRTFEQPFREIQAKFSLA